MTWNISVSLGTAHAIPDGSAWSASVRFARSISGMGRARGKSFEYVWIVWRKWRDDVSSVLGVIVIVFFALCFAILVDECRVAYERWMDEIRREDCAIAMDRLYELRGVACFICGSPHFRLVKEDAGGGWCLVSCRRCIHRWHIPKSWMNSFVEVIVR